MKKITVEVSEELAAFKDRTGIRWRAILEMGAQTPDLRFENTDLKSQIQKLQTAIWKMQKELLITREENDQLKLGIKPKI